MLQSHVNQPTLPFSNNIKIRTTDLDEMEVFLQTGSLLEKRALTVLNGSRKIDAEVSSVVLNKIHLMGVHLGAEIIARSVPLQVAQVVIPISSRLTNSPTRKNELLTPKGSAIVHTPNYPVEVKWEKDTYALVVRIPKYYLQKIYQSYFNEEMPGDFKFGSHLDLTSGPGHSLSNVIFNIKGEIDSNNKFIQDNRMLKLWEELLVTTLLSSQQQIDTKILKVKNSCPVYHYVKRATDFMMENLEELITLEQLVKASGVSARTLQMGFKKIHGIGPMAFLREQKLDQVHKELVKGIQDNASIANIAAKWGFYHPSHFSKLYRQRFSELPSETVAKNHCSIYLMN